jgi:hemolysin activation/secretion protein
MRGVSCKVFFPRVTATAAAMIAFASPITVYSQQSGSTAPGRVESDLRREPQPLKGDAINLDRTRFPEQVPDGAKTAVLLLSNVEISGNTALNLDKLSSIWKDSLGKRVTLADAFAIAAKVTARYRESGYILSQAVVVKQDLVTEGATLRIEVLEGRIDKIAFNGLPELHTRLAAHVEPLRAEKPLTLATLERYLLLLNEIGGLSAKANLKPSTQANASDLEIVLARNPVGYSLNLHNRVSKALGPQRAEFGVDFNGGFTGFERHSLRVISSLTKQINLVSGSGEMPIGIDGLKINWSASSSKSSPSSALGASLDNASNNFSLGLSYPVIRSRQTNFGLRTNLGGYNNRSDVSGINKSKDSIRALRAGASFDYADSAGGLNLLDVELSKGLSSLGASEKGDVLLSNPGGNPQFTKSTLYVARLQSLGGAWSLLAAASGQWSKDKLVSAEKFGLGGELFLRAFDPSEVIGDSGTAGKLELRYAQSIASVPSTFYSYFDAGQSVTNNATGNTRKSLTSAGLGVRFTAPNRLKGFIEIAKPGMKNSNSTGNQNVRVFAGIGFDF